jgi:hypothetical protein
MAMTRNVPAVVPAVYLPEDPIVPPVADQVTATLRVEPSENRPVAVKSARSPGAKVSSDGVSTTAVSVECGGWACRGVPWGSRERPVANAKMASRQHVTRPGRSRTPACTRLRTGMDTPSSGRLNT